MRTLSRVAMAATLLLLLALLVRAQDVVRSMETVADYVSPLTLAHDAHLYPGSRITLGNYGWYSGFWAARGVGWLPLGDKLSALAPFLITLVLSGLVVAQARRVWGTPAAVCCAALSLSMGSEAWKAAASWSAHFTSWWVMAIAGLTVVAAAGGRRRAAVAGAVATILWGGACLAGDKLVIAAVLVPLAAAAVAAARHGQRRLAVAGVALIGLTVLSALVWNAVRTSDHLVQHTYPIHTVAYASLGTYVGLALTGIVDVWQQSGPAVLAATTGYVAAALAVGAVLSAPRAVRAQTELPRVVWTVFWAVASVAVVAAFVVNSTSSFAGQPVPRYLYALPLATGAVLAAVTGSGHWRRAALAAGTVVAAATAVSFLTQPPARSGDERAAARANVVAAVRQYHLAKGYASYNTGYAMERASKYALRLAPVGTCGNGVGLCPFYLHRIDAAYTPVPGIHTFMLLDHSAPLVTREWLTAAPAGAIRQLDVGAGLEMFIYDHDVASDIGPIPPLDLP